MFTHQKKNGEKCQRFTSPASRPGSRDDDQGLGGPNSGGKAEKTHNKKVSELDKTPSKKNYLQKIY